MIAVALGYAAMMIGGPVFVAGYMWFCLEGAADLAAAARLAARAARALFLAIGWAAAIARLFLA